MNDLMQKLKGLYGKLQTKQVSYERPAVKPTEDWHMILSSVFSVLIIVAGLSFYFYVKINNGELFIVPDSTVDKEVKIDSSLLKKTVDRIHARESSLSNIKQNRNIPSDPSV